MTAVPPGTPLDHERRARIRARAAFLRRRRRQWSGLAAAAAAVVVVVGAITVVAATRSGDRHGQVLVNAPCPASMVPVQVRSGESAAFTEIPRGYRVVSGDPANPDTAPLLVQPPVPAGASASDLPDFSLQARPVASATPPAPSPSIAHPVTPGTTTTSQISVGGLPATETITTEPDGTTETGITWAPDPGTQLDLVGVRMPPAEMVTIADGVRFHAGTTATLPAAPTSQISAAQARDALPVGRRAGAATALSAWAEIDHVRAGSAGRQGTQAGADYRSAWLAWAPAGAGRTTWVIVDAHTGKVLEGPSAQAAGWVRAVTDRSRPGCQPPLGVLTRSEMSEVAFGSPLAPAGATLTLTDASSDLAPNGSPPGCAADCDPLVWVADQPSRTSQQFGSPISAAPGQGRQLDVYDAVLGDSLGSRSGGAITGSGVEGPDLDPGPTPTAPPTNPTARPSVPAVGPVTT